MPARDLIHDVVSALGLLTRFPVNLTAAPQPRAAWAWPLAGLLVGALAAFGGAFGLWLGLVPGVVAALVLGVEAAATGGLHEDGLADCADGFWGGRDKARRLEIMKDSRVGSYGVLALVLVTLARWSALTALLVYGDHWAALVATGAISRAPMALVMALLPNARGSGLSHATGRPAPGVAVVALGLATGLALAVLGWSALGPLVVAAGIMVVLSVVALRKIGGQTGDILGALQQLVEVGCLTALAAAAG